MFGYFLAFALLIYFFVFWPRFDNLPPRSARMRRQRLAGKLGLHDEPSVGELELTATNKKELLNYITLTDTSTYKKIEDSNHFYLVESRKSKFSLYCSIEKPTIPIDYYVLQTNKLFTSIQIEEHLLIRFLTELTRIRRV